MTPILDVGGDGVVSHYHAHLTMSMMMMMMVVKLMLIRVQLCVSSSSSLVLVVVMLLLFLQLSDGSSYSSSSSCCCCSSLVSKFVVLSWVVFGDVFRGGGNPLSQLLLYCKYKQKPVLQKQRLSLRWLDCIFLRY